MKLFAFRIITLSVIYLLLLNLLTVGRKAVLSTDCEFSTQVIYFELFVLNL